MRREPLVIFRHHFPPLLPARPRVFHPDPFNHSVAHSVLLPCTYMTRVGQTMLYRSRDKRHPRAARREKRSVRSRERENAVCTRCRGNVGRGGRKRRFADRIYLVRYWLRIKTQEFFCTPEIRELTHPRALQSVPEMQTICKIWKIFSRKSPDQEASEETVRPNIESPVSDKRSISNEV